MEDYIVVGWPEIQYLMGQKGFRKHAELIMAGSDYEKYGDSAYYVEKGWIDGLSEPIKDMIGYVQDNV